MCYGDDVDDDGDERNGHDDENGCDGDGRECCDDDSDDDDEYNVWTMMTTRTMQLTWVWAMVWAW